MFWGQKLLPEQKEYRDCHKAKINSYNEEWYRNHNYYKIVSHKYDNTNDETENEETEEDNYFCQ